MASLRKAPAIFSAKYNVLLGPFLLRAPHEGYQFTEFLLFRSLRRRVCGTPVAVCRCSGSCFVVFLAEGSDTHLWLCKWNERFTGRRLQSSRFTKCLPPRYLPLWTRNCCWKPFQSIQNFLGFFFLSMRVVEIFARI